MMNIHTLVIAYGNRLRGDDGVGPAAGDIVKSWQTPGVKVLIVQQLLPELIEEMKHAARVLFVDGAINVSNSAYIGSIVVPKKSRRSLGHHELPANLLALLRDLEGRAPEAWLLTISASSFEHGEQITPLAEKCLKEALTWIRNWLAEQTCTKSA